MPHDLAVFNITEAAAFLGAHEQTVRRRARRGAVPCCFKVGRDWRFRKEALLRWADGQRVCRASGQVLIAKPIDAAQVQKVVALLVGERQTGNVRIEPEARAP